MFYSPPDWSYALSKLGIVLVSCFVAAFVVISMQWVQSPVWFLALSALLSILGIAAHHKYQPGSENVVVESNTLKVNLHNHKRHYPLDQIAKFTIDPGQEADYQDMQVTLILKDGAKQHLPMRRGLAAFLEEVARRHDLIIETPPGWPTRYTGP